ncbi:MAG: hypothetical protein WCR56_07095 [Bacilli bacterium]
MNRKTTSAIIAISTFGALVGTGLGLALSYPSLMNKGVANTNDGGMTSLQVVKNVSKTTSSDLVLTAALDENNNTIVFNQNSISDVVLIASVSTDATSDYVNFNVNVNITGVLSSYIYTSKVADEVNTEETSYSTFVSDFSDGTYSNGKTTLEIPLSFNWIDEKEPTDATSFVEFVNNLKTGDSNISIKISL